jgi:dihydroxycyclohexadiene carboxylate dehydrogenase
VSGRDRFCGKVMMVTGAAQGIGRAVAASAAKEGALLVLVDRANFLGEVTKELEAFTEAIAVEVDLESYAGATSAVSRAIERFGRVDILVNGVGGTIWMKPYAEYAEHEIEAEIRRSLFPTLWCCRAVLPSMIVLGAGVIVNVSSVATRGINRVPYAAAKGGINAVTACLAMEYAEHGIRVVATAPGGTTAPPRRVPRNPQEKSEQEKVWGQQVVDQTTESALMKRYGTLEDQAAAILFLASDEAEYITGSTLPVAGGDLG